MLNELENNIKDIKNFVEYLENNYKDHSKTALTSTNLDEIQNSMFFLADYAEVAKEFMRAIEIYSKKTGYEL